MKAHHRGGVRKKSLEGGNRPTEPRFRPVRVVPSSPSPAATPIEIALSNGRVVRVRPGFDPTMLERVLAIAAEAEASC